MHILIVRPGAIGDALLTFPVMQALRAQYEHSNIFFVSNSAVLPLAQAFGLADEVSDYGAAQWSELFSERGSSSSGLQDVLRRTNYAICWLRDSDGIVEQNLRAANIFRIVVAPGRPPEGCNTHIVEYLARTIGIHVDVGMQLIVPNLSSTSNFGTMNWTPTFAIHIGSGSARKCWPVSSFAAVITRLWQRQISILLLAGPADSERLADLLRRIGTPPDSSLFQLMVNEPLLEVVRQLQCCRGYLGNDSGITHLAALLGLPTIALFGLSGPTLWRPVGPSVRVLHEPLLEHISVDRVMRSIEAVLET